MSKFSQSGTGRNLGNPKISTGQIVSRPGRQAQRLPLDTGKEEPQDRTVDSLIADMAKGFVAAQAQMSCQPAGTNEEILNLLQKISLQLEGLQGKKEKPAPNSGRQSQDNSSESSLQENAKAKQESATPAANGGGGQSQQSAELEKLFSQLMAAGKQGNTAGSASQNQSQDTNSQQQGVPAQTAAQALAKAQLELSQELEASLKKLKQVIATSEELANRIGNMIGQENNIQ